jgi:hypothetical protein
MTDKQWRQIWELYRIVSELPEKEQSSYLASVSADSEVLEQLLLLMQEPDQPLETPSQDPGPKS